MQPVVVSVLAWCLAIALTASSSLKMSISTALLLFAIVVYLEVDLIQSLD